MKTSIVIITYNGSDRLPRLLNSIGRLNQQDFEVVIVDDGSEISPSDIVESLALKYPWRIIRQENRGRGSAKNTGARCAEGDLLWFLDDDMRVDADTLSAHIAHHNTHANSVCVGSTIEESYSDDTDIRRYRTHISDIWQKALELLPKPITADTLFIASANFSIERNLFFHLGGFKETLNDAEDLDLAYRCYLDNVPVFYDKNAVGYHKDMITCRSYVMRSRQYNMAYQKLRALEPGYLSVNNRLRPIQISNAKRFYLFFISQPFFVYLIDNFNIFLVLPRKIRYIFYSQIIFGLSKVFLDRELFR